MEINEQRLESILKEQREEFQRYPEVLAKSVARSAEMVSRVQRQIEDLHERVVKNTEDIAIIKNKQAMSGVGGE